jgi:plastocyanin domain-containing protein
LRAGTIVTAHTEPASAAASHTVRVTDRGYQPATLAFSAGKATAVTFIRESESSCGEEVVVPALKLTRKLPLNEPVTIHFPPQKEGELTFSCGMHMLEGKVIVR